MSKKTKVGIPIAVLLAVIGGAWTINLDLSNTTNNETNFFGDIINNILDDKEVTDRILDEICRRDLIPHEYEIDCRDWNG